MTDKKTSSGIWLALLLLLAAIAGTIALGVPRGSLEHVIGDEGTFMSMAASVARDGDLKFGTRDLARLRQAPPGGRLGVILQRTDDGVAFSKPVPYALYTAPFYFLMGEWGMLVANALALALALLLAFEHACRLGRADRAALTVATFAGAGALVSYVGWRMSDALQVSLALAGLVLCTAQLVPPREASSRRLGRLLDHPWAPWIGALALGVAAVMRYPNALLGVGVAAAWVFHGRWRKGLSLALVVVVGFAAMSFVNFASSGAAVPYKAVRASFDPTTGYPVGDGAQEALAHFETHRATHSLSLKPTLEPVVSLYATLYFFIGRHSGVLLYFPAALIFLVAALWKPDRRGLAVVAAGVGIIVFYLVWMPRNYFGGEGFVGNRYFLTAYAALLVGLPRLPRRRWLAVAWMLALIAFGSAVVSVRRTQEIDQTSQSHAHAGAFRLLPYESIARAIDGRRDRYWSDEFLRFVDPYAEVGPWAFRLASDDPAAEVQVANQRKWGVMRMVVHADAPRIVLEYDDWRSHQEFEVVAEAAGGNATGVVEILPSKTWREHPFWWDPAKRFFARSFRLAIRTPDGSPARAEVRYLGPYHRPHRIFASEVEELELPTEAVAGTRGAIPVRIRNRSRQVWSSERVLPVYLTYLIVPHDGGWNPREGIRTPIVEPVEPGEILTGPLQIEWPEEPGNYDLIVDLLVEGVFWFKERAGAPLAEGVVKVLPASAPDDPQGP